MKAVHKIRSWVGYSFTQNLKEISLGWGMKELKVFHCKLVLINRETYFELTHKHTHTRINLLSISLDDAVYIPEQKMCTNFAQI